MKKYLIILLAAISAAATPAFARVTIDITQGNVDPMPVAAPNFLGADEATQGLGRDITGLGAFE